MGDPSWARRLGPTLFALVGAWAAGCSSSEAEHVKAAALGGGCSINSDCAGALVCAFRRCHVECTVDRDCDPGQRCMVSDKPFHVCQLSDEVDCSYNSECPGEQVCGADGQCRDQCSSDRDCVNGQICTARTCASPAELVDGGLVDDPDSGAPGRSCEFASQCPEPQRCIDGRCRLECLADRDCAVGETCAASRCTPAGTTLDAGGACTHHSECAVPLKCLGGTCVPECLVDRDCEAEERCLANLCVFEAPVGAPPGYGAECALSSECNPGLVCRASRCVWECVTSVDCAPSWCCAASHACVTGGSCLDAGAPDSGVPDAAFDAAACGADLDCQDGLQCNGFERCVAGSCQLATRAACDDANPCTTDTCSESSGCSYVATGPQDSDGDGYYAASCGAGGTDCDDTDRLVHPGTPEACNQRDDNCDGAVDEALWQLGTVTPLGAVASAVTGDYDLALATNGDVVVVANQAPGSLRTWRLTPALAIATGPTTGVALANTTRPRIVSGPGGFALAVVASNYDPSAISAVALADLTPVALLAETAYSVAPFWNGAGYTLAWADGRDGTPHLFLGSLPAAGAPSANQRRISSDPLLASGYFTLGYPVLGEASGGRALIAWTGPAPYRTRYAVTNADGSATLVEPREVPGDTHYPWQIDAAHGTFYVADYGSTGPRVTRIDPNGDVTGQVSRTYGGYVYPSVSATPHGLLMACAVANRIEVGYLDPTLAREFAPTVISFGTNDVGAVSVAAIDDTHAVAIWNRGGTLYAGALGCGP